MIITVDGMVLSRFQCPGRMPFIVSNNNIVIHLYVYVGSEWDLSLFSESGLGSTCPGFVAYFVIMIIINNNR